MIVHAHAKEGKKFTLTELGFEIGRIRAKYEENSPHRKSYEKTAPQKWLDEGWIQEVDK